MTDINTLLAPVAPDTPCGIDLEYDPEFLALEQAAQGKPEQVFGTTIVPAEEPDWGDVRRRAAALLGRTKDLRVALLLARALTHDEHLPGLAAGLALLGELLERYWDAIHPRLDPNEGNDPLMRLNALAGLIAADALPRDLRAAWVVRPGPYGRLAVRELLTALGKLAPTNGEATVSEGQALSVLRGAAAHAPAELEAAQAALDQTNALQTLLNRKFSVERATDLRPLRDTLQAVAQATATVRGRATGDSFDTAGSAGGIPGEIVTREEALRLLDRVCTYLERTEPANPAPLLIRRAQRLMTKNFVQIIEDLAPDSLTQIRNIAGLSGE